MTEPTRANETSASKHLQVVEQRRERSEEVLSLLVTAVGDYAIFALDLDGKVLTWNTGARRLKGYTESEIVGQHFSRFYTPEDIARAHPQYELVQAERNGVYEEEGWRVRKDGTRFWANVVITALRDASGVLCGYGKVTRDLTERKRAEDALRESEERFRLLVTDVQDYAILTLDARGYVTSWNLGAERIKGYTSAEIIDKHFSIFHPKADIDCGKPALELEIAEREGRYEEEGWRVRKDGSAFWTSVSLTALRDDSGALHGFAKVTRDLTARRQAEEALRQSEERYRLLVDGIHDYAIIMLDPNGRVTSWNEGAHRIKGYTRSEILGSHFSRFYRQEDIDARKPELELRTAIETGRYEDEGYRVRKDGSKFWANVVVSAIRDQAGTLLGFSKVTRDVSDRRAADEVLRQSEERFRLMIEGVRDYAIFMLDPDGNVATWNEGAKRNKGYTADEIIGKHFSTFYPPEDLQNGKPAYELKETIAQGRFEDLGWRVRKDGTRFWANVIITAIKDKQGKLLGFSKVTRDLTEKRRTEQALQKAYEELEQRVKERTDELSQAKDQAERAVKVRDQFLSIASHELKTPLTSLMLQTQMRKRNLAKPNAAAIFSVEKLNDMVDDDARQVKRLAHLIDDMLDISRLTSGKFLLELEDADLCAIVAEVIDRFSPQLEAAGMALTLDAPRDIMGHWDRYRIEQVVTNLITNAMKYGAGKPVQIILSVDAARAKILVRDQGIGIAKQDQARVFEQFERAVAPGSISGLGLGLYIVKQIITAHGGTISVESELGRGATFVVELPLNSRSENDERTV